MKKSTLPTIASFFPHINDLFHKRILRGIQEAVVEYNFNLIVYSLNNDIKGFIENNSIYNLFNLHKIDGLIICNTKLASYINDEKFLEFYEKYKSIPLINIGKPFNDIPSVVADNFQGMFDLTEHFIKEHGCNNIVFMHGGKKNEDANIRFDAYKNALEKNNIIYNPDLVIYSNFSNEEIIENEFKSFLNKNIHFDSIISSSDLIAKKVFEILENNNIRVPEDVLLAGFDDMENSKYFLPPLTTVFQQEYQQAKTAIKLMNELINGRPINKKTVIPSVPIIRKSCGCSFSGLPGKKNINNIVMTNLKINVREEIIKKVTDNLNHPYIDKIEFTKLLTQMYDAYLEDINNNKEDKNLFYNTFNTILKNDFFKFKDFSYWKNIIDFLNQVFDIYQDDELLFKYKHKYIFKNVMNCFSELETVNYQYKQVKYFYLTESIIFSFSTINSKMNLAQLPDAIEAALNSVNINSCYISLFETPGDGVTDDMQKNKSFLFFSYKDKKKQKINNDVLFPSINFVPDNINIFDERKTYIIYLLNFNHNNYGFMLLENNTRDYFVYEVLQSNISNALKGADLIDEQIKTSREIERLSSQKLNIFINIAHETKTPLTIINNYFEKYIDTNMSNELSIIKYNFDKLRNNMINLLDLEKIDRAGLLYNHDTIINLSNAVNSKSKLFKEIAANKNIIIDTYIEKDIFIKIDPEALDRILNNLLDNAVKYTGHNGMIDIVLIKNNENAELHIKDTGIGIPEEKKEVIFKPYYQISHEKSNFQGLGIGLNIVKKIVDEINGCIKVESEINKGTVFKIIFNNYELEERDHVYDKFMLQNYPLSMSSIKLHDEKYNPELHNILLVEDNLELLAYLQMELFDKYNIFYAFNGEDAFKKLKNIPKPDLIISDIMMDVMNGYQFYDAISVIKKYANIPFIFLTAISSYDEKIKGLEKGAVDFISKPFKMKELQVKISSILRNLDAQKESNIIEFENKIHKLLQKDNNAKYNKLFYFKQKCKEFGISNKEGEVIKLLLKGYEYKEIGSLLDISLNTVKTHIAHIYKKCGVQNKIELSNIII